MNARTPTLTLGFAALAAALSLGAQAADTTVGHDGWKDLGSGYTVFVGTPGVVGKSRAEVKAELAAHARNPVSADGWKDVGNGYSVYVGPPAGSIGKTRAQVQAELAAFQRDTVTADGWQQRGDSIVYVGVQGPSEQRAQVPTDRKTQ